MDNFCFLYDTIRQKHPDTAKLADTDIIRGFLVYEADTEAAVAFIEAFPQVSDLGFGEEQVIGALLMCKNEVEAAIDYLMRSQ